MKKQKIKLGPLEMQLLSYAQMRKKDILSLGELANVAGITKKQERELFSRLSRTGILIRLNKGVYLVPPNMPAGGRWTVSGYYILSKLMEILQGTYQISGPNAFNLYGFDDQVPNRIYVYNDRLFGEKEIGGTDFIFIKTDAKRLGSTKSMKTPDGIESVMVSKTRALVDSVYDWSRFNTLPRAYGWIAETLKKDQDITEKLIDDTFKYSNKGTMKRIGYLLAQLGIADNRLLELKRKLGPAKSLIPWIPGQPTKGSVNKEWGLIINGAIPQ
ncbi:MAG: type IV toxin-antitoxin system AbiEi family antitoxin domain-containing protein [Deltaproteobacteria bacterium]|nr:type IV toxin-antitoxin system AbiEi family antitoxin domain-containing protein [Deltaproteobacteria bacterium]